jgi:hypothetical protein
VQRELDLAAPEPDVRQHAIIEPAQPAQGVSPPPLRCAAARGSAKPLGQCADEAAKGGRPPDGIARDRVAGWGVWVDDAYERVARKRADLCHVVLLEAVLDPVPKVGRPASLPKRQRRWQPSLRQTVIRFLDQDDKDQAWGD